MKKAVVLLSGGVDSSTTAAIAKAEGYEIYALSIDYAQRHKIELDSAKKVAENLGAKKHLIINFDLREIGGSALTSDIEVPKSQIDMGTVPILRLRSAPSVNQGQSPIPVTYVPARNTIFLSFALSWAETLEAPDIFIGANAVDYSGYPDCRPEYLKAFEDMANLATKVSVEGKIKFNIKAPLLYMTKGDIIKKGVELGFDYSLTWSCYDPQEIRAKVQKSRSAEGKTSDLPNFRANYVPCGKCDSCIFRAKGFQEAGIKDPLLLKL
ncbi:MAG: 7-cyano-7-deazaguanine synthase QueC [Nitrospirae bacterium]|nr:7-cyano-7-deazaguanine synthase QueC [Nitrospirota bacterium]